MTTSQDLPGHEAERHRKMILLLSEELGWPKELVAAAYGRELRRLGETASVRTYLPILIFKALRQEQVKPLAGRAEEKP